jgi:hypothetical protein
MAKQTKGRVSQADIKPKTMKSPEKMPLNPRINVVYKGDAINFINIPEDATAAELNYELKRLEQSLSQISFASVHPIKSLLRNLLPRHLSMSDYPQLCRAVITALDKPELVLTLSDIASLMYTAYSMPRNFLKALLPRLEEVLAREEDISSSLSAFDKGNLLNAGLCVVDRDKHSSSKINERLLAAMKMVVERTELVWSSTAISFALNGVRSISLTEQYQRDYLVKLLESINRYLDHEQQHQQKKLEFTRRQISYTIHGLMSLRQSDERDQMMSLIHRLIQKRIDPSIDTSIASLNSTIEGFRFIWFQSNKNLAEEKLVTAWCEMHESLDEESFRALVISSPPSLFNIIAQVFPYLKFQSNDPLWTRYLSVITRSLKHAPAARIQHPGTISGILLSLRLIHGYDAAEQAFLGEILRFLRPCAFDEVQSIHAIAGFRTMLWQSSQQNQLLEFLVKCLDRSCSLSALSMDNARRSYLIETHGRYLARLQQCAYHPVSAAMSLCCDTLYRYEASELGQRYLDQLATVITKLFPSSPPDRPQLLLVEHFPLIIHCLIQITGQHPAELRFLDAIVPHLRVNQHVERWMEDKLSTRDLMKMMTGLQSLHQQAHQHDSIKAIYELMIRSLELSHPAKHIFSLSQVFSIIKSLSTGKVLLTDSSSIARQLFHVFITRILAQAIPPAPRNGLFDSKQLNEVCLSLQVLNKDHPQEEDKLFVQLLTSVITHKAYFPEKRIIISASNFVTLFGRITRFAASRGIDYEKKEFLLAVNDLLDQRCAFETSTKLDAVDEARLIRYIGYINAEDEGFVTSFLAIAVDILKSAEPLTISSTELESIVSGSGSGSGDVEASSSSSSSLSFDSPFKQELLQLLRSQCK